MHPVLFKTLIQHVRLVALHVGFGCYIVACGARKHYLIPAHPIIANEVTVVCLVQATRVIGYEIDVVVRQHAHRCCSCTFVYFVVKL